MPNKNLHTNDCDLKGAKKILLFVNVNTVQHKQQQQKNQIGNEQ